MSLDAFSAKWFLVYYVVLGCSFLGLGLFLILKHTRAAAFLTTAAQEEKPPSLLIKALKYFFLFSLPGVILSFTPFSWIELLFTLWSLILVYVAGIQLVRWNHNRMLIKHNSNKLPALIRRSGAIMVAVGSAIFLLAIWVIQRAPIK